jgi:hypothetical protein
MADAPEVAAAAKTRGVPKGTKRGPYAIKVAKYTPAEDARLAVEAREKKFRKLTGLHTWLGSSPAHLTQFCSSNKVTCTHCDKDLDAAYKANIKAHGETKLYVV